MRSAFFTLATIPALVACAPVADDGPLYTSNVPDPTQVQFTGFTYGGTGCPQGSVANVTSPDKTTVTLIFDSYVASLGPSVAVAENRKNCQLNYGLKYPGGFQFSVLSVDYRGYAALDSGVQGVQKSTYYFSGQTNQASTQTSFTGPKYEDYLVEDLVESTSTVWSPCGASGNLNINSQVRLIGTSDNQATGLMTTDSIDAKFTQKIYFQWREC